jgi:coenzyme F420 hydrogenase subunit beta
VVNGRQRLDRAIREVVESESCSGCGACCLLDSGLRMRLTEQGYLRPFRDEDGGGEPAVRTQDPVSTFDAVCPGRTVAAQRPPGSRRHPSLGPVVSSWEAWAADPELRHRGSSGGTLTALASWLAETGQAARVLASAAGADDPTRTVPLAITTRDHALQAAGSRYAPVATAAQPDAVDPTSAVVGKPCEISALRALQSQLEPGSEPPLLLSFFCAGTPSQWATDELVADLGVAPTEKVTDLWYRGRGWPGRFTAVTDDRSASTDYDDSWGRRLGPAMQWRCKMCPDGVGESADIVAGDFWQTDARGYPLFTEGEGVSALIARTLRGHEVLLRSREAGVLVMRAIDPDAIASVQPFQVKRRRLLAARLRGARLAGRTTPRYRGFGLTAMALRRPRESLRAARATWRRVRSGTTVRVPGRPR